VKVSNYHNYKSVKRIDWNKKEMSELFALTAYVIYWGATCFLEIISSLG